MRRLLKTTLILGTIILFTQKCDSSTFIENNITLTIDQGTLFGKISLDYWNGTFYSFEGIPFAKPPVGELRFKPPEPAEKWSGVYDATQLRPVCPQTILPFVNIESMEQSEDCLFLNVYTKMSTELKPVMVYVHGGGFRWGSIFDKRIGPQLLMTEDIVLVFIAYRLHAFGFASLDDPKYGIHGNMALKDMVLGLKWVQKNIHHFGGNSHHVTIFGESAGGSAVDFLCLSPSSQGLFQRAILQSGTVGCDWLTTPIKFIDFAEPLQCPRDNLDEFVKCINQTSTENILKGLKALQSKPYHNEITKTSRLYPFNSLIIEKNNSNSFFVEDPQKILKKGEFTPVPMIIGFNTDESLLFAKYYYVQPNFTDNRVLIPTDIKIDLASNEAIELGNKIKNLYYGTQQPSHDLYDSFIQYLSDIFFIEKIYKSAKLHSMVADRKTAPVYFYEFNYYTKLNYLQNTAKKYVQHADDIAYLFYTKGVTPENLDKNSEEYIGIHRMIKLWTTFAKTGDPNPIDDPLLPIKWLPIEPDTFNYLKISQNLELKQNPFERRMKFWEEIYKEYNSN